MSTRTPNDLEMRLAATRMLARLSHIYRDAVPWREIDKGFAFRGNRIRFASRAGGIFKPVQMDRVLSISTVVPRPGRGVQYADQVAGGGKDGMWFYDMRDRNPAHHQNQWLKTARGEGLPLIYLRGLAPAVYLPLFPVYVTDWDANADRVRVILGLECTTRNDLVAPDLMVDPLPRYTYRHMQARMHVARFRVDVLKAYRGTCALSGLAQPQLVDAVSIAPMRRPVKPLTLRRASACPGSTMRPLTPICSASIPTGAYMFPDNWIPARPGIRSSAV